MQSLSVAEALGYAWRCYLLPITVDGHTFNFFQVIAFAAVAGLVLWILAEVFLR